MADTSTPAGRKREAALIAAGKAAEGADIPAEQLNRVRAAADVAQASEFVARMGRRVFRRDRPRRIERVRRPEAAPVDCAARCTVTRKS